jgi:hypothetical protein
MPGKVHTDIIFFSLMHRSETPGGSWQRARYKCGGYTVREVQIGTSSTNLNALLSAWTGATCQGVTVAFTTGSVNFYLSAEYPIQGNITLVCRASTPVTLTANALMRHFRVSGGSLTADNIVFTSPASSLNTLAGQGGSIAVTAGGSAAFIGCTFRGNFVRSATSALGGAIFASSSGLALRSCTFVGNGAYASAGAPADGGAIFLSMSSATITSTSFLQNGAYGKGQGGAVYVAGGSLTARSANFTLNFADAEGGAVYLGSGTLAMTESSFSRNTNAVTPQDDVFTEGGAITTCTTASDVVLEAWGAGTCPVSECSACPQYRRHSSGR